MLVTHNNKLKDLLKNTKNIAIVGASPSSERDSFKVMKYLIEQGYKIFPVNPKEKDILGIRCYPNLHQLKKEFIWLICFVPKNLYLILPKKQLR